MIPESKLVEWELKLKGIRNGLPTSETFAFNSIDLLVSRIAQEAMPELITEVRRLREALEIILVCNESEDPIDDLLCIRSFAHKALGLKK